jgi:hypothetical protein
MVSRSFKRFSQIFTIINFLFASLKVRTNFENASETLHRIPFCVIGRCSPVPTSHWLQGNCSRINLSQAASGMILQNRRQHFPCQNHRYGVCKAGYWKDYQNY